MDLQKIKAEIYRIRDERDWAQYHTPKNLAASLAVESAEVLEIFQWKTDYEATAYVASAPVDLADELSDVAVYLIELASLADIDLESAILAKLAKNELKYPISKARGSAVKYDKL